MTLQRLSALRGLMASQPTALAAYIVPTADAHNSEYINPTDARRAWLTGFTGSAGTAVVTRNQALVWTDGRYYTQFEKQADMTAWTLMKMSLPDTPTMEKWLSTQLQPGAVVGADPHTMTHNEWTPLESALKQVNIELIPVSTNLVDDARKQLNDPPPPRTNNEIFPLPLKYTGKTAGDKIAEIRKKMAERKATTLVITALDEIAYTLNLRGSDIEYNPVFFAYLLITPSNVTLFTQNGQLSNEAQAQLSNENVSLTVCDYDAATTFMRDMAVSNFSDGKETVVWMSGDSSEAVYRAASGSAVICKPLQVITEVSPVQLMKMNKNEVELKGIRACHIRDGIAVVRLFCWLDAALKRGQEVTEMMVDDKLLEFRRQEKDFMGPSFATIPGAGENGAIIHYNPSRDGPQRVITSNDMFLLDSGGQYRDGTTDITRTRHMGVPTEEQIDAYTRVLKGQMRIAYSLFPKGVKGNVLDSFARLDLWSVGLDYAHGTGHGVGHFLNVHEGPSGVSWRPYPNDPGLGPGQILSNEPGYYKVGEFGIRHEDLVQTVDVTPDSDHPRAKCLKGDFDGRGVLGFHTLTVVPPHGKCVDVDMLTDFELNYLNAYNRRVFKTLGPILQKRGFKEEYEWLVRECQPLSRDKKPPSNDIEELIKFVNT